MDLFSLLGGLFNQNQKPKARPADVQATNRVFETMQYPQQPQQPNAGAVRGAVNPLWQQQKGYTPYAPGEGPRTNFNRFR